MSTRDAIPPCRKAHVKQGRASREKSNGASSLTGFHGRVHWLTDRSGEEKPTCTNCQRQGETCDYSIRLNWDGRSKKKDDGRPGSQQAISFATPASPTVPGQHGANGIIHHQDVSGQMSAASAVSNNVQQLRPSASPYTNHLGTQESLLPPITNFTHNLPLPAVDFNPTILPPLPLLRNPTWGESGTNGHYTETSPMPPLRHTLSLPSYPSPADSGFGSPGLVNGIYGANGHSLHMPPPTSNPNPMIYQEAASSPFNNAKRMRLSPRTDSFNRNPTLLQRAGSYGPNDTEELARVQFNPHTPTFVPTYFNNPLTPAASSTSHVDNDDRRISVSSLLSEDPEPDEAKQAGQSDRGGAVEEVITRRGSLHQRMISYSETETYGQDRGHPDLDIPRNNDTVAISGMSPSEHSDFEAWLRDTDVAVPEFGFGLVSRDTVFAKGGYYATPVPIKIPRKLEPLPRTLSENPMNLLYFHHFLNHTARILVPHDCPENPFKTILPKSK